MLMRSLSFLVLMAFSASLLSAQKFENRLSEEEVSQDAMFLEAKKAKILGDLENARKLFEVMLEKHQNHDAAAYELAEIHMLNAEYDDAEQLVNLALGIDGANEWYQLLKAEIFKRQQNFAAVAQVYDDLVKMQPDNLEFLRSKALYLSEANQHEDAIRVFDQIEGKIGVTERTSFLKFELYKQMGKAKKAIAELDRLIERFPRELNHRHVLATYLRGEGKTTQMQQVYEGILSIDPDDPRANVAMASSYRKQGDHESYLLSIRPIVENPDADVDIKIAELMPYVRIIEKNPNDTQLQPLLELLEVLEKAHPNNAKAAAIHADVLNLAGKEDLAIQKFKATISLDPSNYLVWEQYLNLLLNDQEMEQLASEAEQAMDYFPNQAYIFYLHGLATTSLEKYAQATESLEQALLMSGRQTAMKVSINALLGKAYHHAGDFAQSEMSFTEALSLAPKDARVLSDYAYHLALQGKKTDKARSLIDQALDQEPNNAHYLATKGLVLYKMGELDQSKSLYTKALKSGGSSVGIIQEHFGDLLYTMGETDQAVAAWTKAKDLGVISEVLQRKIAERKLIDAQ